MILGKLARFIRNYRYTLKHRKQAHSALNQLELEDGIELNNNQKKEIDTYALKKFGHKKYAPWLYVYSKGNKQGSYQNFIPDNYYGEILVPALCLFADR